MDSRQTSTITLYRGVELDDTYSDLVDFNSDEEFQNWLNTHASLVMSKSSYQRLDKPIKWDQNLGSFNETINFNYVKIENTDDVNHLDKVYYGFITNFEYVNDGLTNIYFSIDDWNTYRWQVNLNSAFIERAFVKELNDNGTDFNPIFKQVMNMPEDIGGDGCSLLEDYGRCNFNWDAGTNQWMDDQLVKYIVFTCQPKNPQNDGGSYLTMYSQYDYYVLPFDAVNGVVYNVNINGANVCPTGGQQISDVFKKLASDPDLVGTSSLVVDCKAFDYIGLNFTINSKTHTLTLNDNHIAASADKNMVRMDRIGNDAFTSQETFISGLSLGNWSTNNTVVQNLVNVYRKLYAPMCHNSDVPFKILAQPFSKFVIANGKGGEITGDWLRFDQNVYGAVNGIKIGRVGGISEGGLQTVFLKGYNRYGKYSVYDGMSYFNNAVFVDDSARDLPFIVSSYVEFMNANKNRLANVRANALMNEQLQKQGNAITLGNTERSMGASREALAYGNSRRMGMAGIDATLGTVGGLAKGLASGGLVGGVMGAVGGAISGGINMYKTGYNNATAANTLAIQQAAQNQNARINYAFQNKAATLHYQMAIRSQNAMLADMANTSPQQAHQGSNYLYDSQLKNNTLNFQLFTCQNSTMQNVINYFLMFGYQVNTYAPIANFLNVKNKFNYVKVSKAQVTGEVNQAVLDTFDKVLENGVTIWKASAINQFINRDISGNNFN